MALTLDADERAELLARSHTAILTTLRADGRPVSLPVWFAVLNGELYVRTPRRSAKVRRADRDPRGSFLVETGEKWAELTALHLDVEVSLVTDEALARRALAAIDEKYDAFRLRTEHLPASAQRHYGDMVILRLRATGPELSWSNTKFRLPRQS